MSAMTDSTVSHLRRSGRDTPRGRETSSPACSRPVTRLGLAATAMLIGCRRQMILTSDQRAYMPQDMRIQPSIWPLVVRTDFAVDGARNRPIWRDV
jgi:hypothetical protein